MQIELTTRGLLTVFFRQQRTFLMIFLLIVLGGVAYLNVAKPQYIASGSLLVKFGHDAISDMARRDYTPQIISQNDRREMIQSNIDILQSHNLLLALVNEFGAEIIYPGITEKAGESDRPEDAAVRRFWKGDLRIKAGQQSNIIDVQLTNGDPELATQLMRRLFALFIARQSQVFNEPQAAFLEEQVRQARTRLEESQQALKDFKIKTGISSIESELGELLRQKSDTGTVSLESLDDTWAKLAELQAEEAQLLTTYRPDSPQVLKAHQAVRLAQQQLQERQSELKARTGKAAYKIDRRISLLESKRKDYNDLMRQVEIDEENYKNFKARSENARISETLNAKNITPISVIDEPLAPKKPARPRKLLILAMCLLSGLIFGGLTILLLETFDQRFTSPAQVTSVLGTPVMATFNAPKG